MKRSLFALAFLMLAALPSFALERRTVLVVDEVIKMSKAGVTDDDIVAWLKKQSDPYQVSGDDVIALTDAHVSKVVMKAVVDESAASLREDDRHRARTRTVYVRPSIGWDPWYYGYSGWYDPFWYGPRLSIGVSLGSRGYYRGPSRYRRHR